MARNNLKLYQFFLSRECKICMLSLCLVTISMAETTQIAFIINQSDCDMEQSIKWPEIRIFPFMFTIHQFVSDIIHKLPWAKAAFSRQSKLLLIIFCLFLHRMTSNNTTNYEFMMRWLIKVQQLKIQMGTTHILVTCTISHGNQTKCFKLTFALLHLFWSEKCLNCQKD